MPACLSMIFDACCNLPIPANSPVRANAVAAVSFGRIDPAGASKFRASLNDKVRTRTTCLDPKSLYIASKSSEAAERQFLITEREGHLMRRCLLLRRSQSMRTGSFRLLGTMMPSHRRPVRGWCSGHSWYHSFSVIVLLLRFGSKTERRPGHGLHKHQTVGRKSPGSRVLPRGPTARTSRSAPDTSRVSAG